MRILLLVCFSVIIGVRSQLPGSRKDIAHSEVIQAAAFEAQLPSNLLNPFYQNPALRPFLAKSSWFGPGEKLVKNRETEKIHRNSIFNVLNHAGLLPQQRL